MQTILASRVDTQERADQLILELRERGIAPADMQAFYVTPPGQHAQFPIGGDQYADPAAEGASAGQAKGAALGAAAGLAVGGVAAAIVPPLAPAILAGVTGAGALAGSVAGAVSATDEAPDEASAEHDEPQATRHAGMMVAVRVTPDTEAIVMDAMKGAGAQDIERATGEWREGHWVDFDPAAPPAFAEPSTR